MISQQLFESHINATLRDWKTTTVDGYLRTIQLVRAMTLGNQLSGDTLAVDVVNDNNNQSHIFLAPLLQFADCVCGLSSVCRVNLGIYTLSTDYGTNNMTFSIPELYFGCSPIEALLQSTLEVFYNQSFLLEIDQYMHIPLSDQFGFSALDSNRNVPDEVVETIINRMMVDSWPSTTDYDAFYSHCAPAACHFDRKGRTSLFIVVTKVMGIFGGLSLAIKIPLLIILRFLEKIHQNLRRYGLKRFIRSLFICHTELQLINRLQITLLLIILVTIYSFSLATRKNQTFEVMKPSLARYQTLQQDFPNSLKCSCSHVSIEYATFLTVRPSFHPICSSAFVSKDWLWYVYGDGRFYRRYPRTDFRYSAIGQFQLIVSLCHLSQDVVNDFLLRLMNTDLINTQLLALDAFDNRIRATMNVSLSATVHDFLNGLTLIREATGINMIMSFFGTNWQFIYDTVLRDSWTIHTTSFVYDGCDCALSRQCSQSSRGMRVGCYPIEALLQTTLACLYDQTCIDPDRHFASLNSSTPELPRFNTSTTFDSLLQHLMVDRYSIDLSYENYFEQCEPSSCTYVDDHYISATTAITPLIGLYGGLVIITRCLAVIIAKFVGTGQRNDVTPVTIIGVS